MIKKRLALLFAVVIVVCAIAPAALATDASQQYLFTLTAQKSGGARESTLSIALGEEITVYLTLTRTDTSAEYPIYAMQDEIQYDSTMFELSGVAVITASGFKTSLRDEKDGAHKRVYMNFVSAAAGGDAYPATLEVGSFTLKAIAKGTTAIANKNAKMSTPTGSESYATTVRDVTVTIGDTDGGGSSGGSGGGTDGGGGLPGGTTLEEPDVPLNDLTRAILETDNHIKYIGGYPNGTVRPNGDITRAEVAIIFYRLIKYTDKGLPYDNVFTDVADGDWYAHEVSYLAELGIMQGYSNGTFRPNAKITREEFATVISRFSDAEPGAEPFPDVAADRWSNEYISTAYNLGWMKGYTDGTFKPQSNITRAEVVTTVNRMLGRLLKAENIPAELSTLYPDLGDAAWARADVIEASVAHSYEFIKDGDGVTERWTAFDTTKAVGEGMD
jgi:hypothetical protein